MALTAITSQKQKLIVNNVVKACKDISKLNKTGYDFLYLSNGFIAHYGINGFKDFYEDSGTLEADIRNNAHQNHGITFTPAQEHYEYYMSKKAVYNEIIIRLDCL